MSADIGPTSLETSEIVVPKDLRRKDGPSFWEKSFEDLFREKFIPLDSRKKVGNYLLGRTIGEGSFSKVRLGRHVENGQKVAIKMLPKKTMLRRQDARRRFFRETKALNKITHENIVRLFEVMETAGNYYLVMELVKGGNFKEFLEKRSQLPEVEARPYLFQVSNAINYIHSLGIVHRDLKPENLLMDESKIKIVDFGLSACLQDGETLTTQCGSPAYAAPEIFNKLPYTQSVDLWSIGVILYLMVCGCLPFVVHHPKSYAQLYAVILRGYDLPRSTLSTDCTDLISRLLQVQPERRISAQSLLQHPWFSPLNSSS